MAQQNARYLMSIVKKAATSKGAKVEGSSVNYLYQAYGLAVRSETLEVLRTEISAAGKAALLDPAMQERILSAMAATFIFHTASKLQQELLKVETGPDAAWNRCMADLVLCSKFHCLHYVFGSFASAVQTGVGKHHAQVGGLLKTLCDLYVLWSLSTDMQYFLREGVLGANHAQWVEELIKDQLFPELRKNAIGLVDTWDLPDFALASVLGHSDGDVYGRYFSAVATSRHQEMAPSGKPFYWDSVVAPLVQL